MFRFQQKLKSLNSKIRKWNREEFRNIFKDKKQLLMEMDLINRQGMESGWSEEMKKRERDLMEHLGARERQEGL